MQTRRDFCRAAIGAASLAIIPSQMNAESQTIVSDPKKPYPSDKPLLQLQQEFVDLKFGMFLHFNMATFQDREWGDPKGGTALFDPDKLDTDQWAAAAKSAGMGYGCLTTKHHDGFCIWPTKTKGDSIRQTPRKIDVVKKYTDSFRKAGLKVGLYYSILDLRGEIQHHSITSEKIQTIKDQLTELLTNYGDINILIFDGWDAPWSRITYEEVPFDEIYALVKKLQPNCLISELNASQYPDSALYYSDIKAYEQNAGQNIPSDSVLPALSCVTLTDGWFWKQKDEGAELKSVDQVVNQWLVPQNKQGCSLILNAAPNRKGLLSDNIVERLAEIGQAWKPSSPPKIKPNVVITTHNLATGKPIRASSSPDTKGPDEANDGKFNSSWCPEYGESNGWLEIDLKQETYFNTLAIVEPVGRWNDYKSSRIKSYRFLIEDGGSWREIHQGATPHRAEMIAISGITTRKLRLEIEGNRDMPHIAELGIYNEPRK